ncbi:MAG: HAD family phosphatase [archaeon]
MIKVVIFDWGGVLIDNPYEGIISYCANDLNVNKELFQKINHTYLHEFERGLIKEKDMWTGVCNDLNIETPTTSSLWYDAVKNNFTEKKDVHNVLHTLRKNNYKTGFLSNTEIPAAKYFFEKDYENLFDATVFSCFEGIAKPEEAIYRTALKRLKVKPEEAVFIDDKPHFIEGAKKIGLQGIVYKNTDQLKQELISLDINLN